MNETLDRSESTLCLYHDDADGRCSAAIVRRAFGKGVILQPMDYGDPVPWEVVERVGRIVITDFSLPKEIMERLSEITSLVWIDHHKSSLDELMDLEELPGKREIGKAACVLTWEVYFPKEPLPRAVAYIGDRDIWRHEFPETKYFSEGLYHEDSRPINERLWKLLLEDNREFIEELIDRGALLYQARIKSIERMIMRYAYEIVFEGHRTLVVNGQASGELGEAIRERGYAIGYCYMEAEQNGELMTFVTLYSDQVDVSEIAKKFSGGGHSGAAGFSFRRRDLPFPKDAVVKRVG